jgi:hypothetical protein
MRQVTHRKVYVWRAPRTVKAEEHLCERREGSLLGQRMLFIRCVCVNKELSETSKVVGHWVECWYEC